MFEEKRLMNVDSVGQYLDMKPTKAREWLEKIGAKRKIGGKALYDKEVIDAYINNMATEEVANDGDQR